MVMIGSCGGGLGSYNNSEGKEARCGCGSGTVVVVTKIRSGCVDRNVSNVVKAVLVYIMATLVVVVVVAQIVTVVVAVLALVARCSCRWR